MTPRLVVAAVLLATPALAAPPEFPASGITAPNLPAIEPPFSPPDLPTLVPAGPQAPVEGADRAFGAFQRGEYFLAMNEALKRVDKKEDPGPAMTLIGFIYENGLGFPKDFKKAAEWYTLGTKEGDSNSMVALAL